MYFTSKLCCRFLLAMIQLKRIPFHEDPKKEEESEEAISSRSGIMPVSGPCIDS